MELQKILEELCGVIEDRKVNPIEGSYTNYLLERGLTRYLKKLEKRLLR